MKTYRFLKDCYQYAIIALSCLFFIKQAYSYSFLPMLDSLETKNLRNLCYALENNNQYGHCEDIGQTDLKKYCIMKTQKKILVHNPCSQIENRKMFHMCQVEFSSRASSQSHCSNLLLTSDDLKTKNFYNLCIARQEQDSRFCFKIENNEDLKNFCLSEDLPTDRLENIKHCHLIKDLKLKNFCLSLTLGKDMINNGVDYCKKIR